jgi:GT2 family glycosyltransferase
MPDKHGELILESEEARLTARGLEPRSSARPEVRGKFLFVDGEKYWVRGVTYGTFRPDEQGEQFPPREQVRRDFAAMAANGINTIRTYTPPPVWLLDDALQHGLRVMVGLAWEQHIAFLDDRTTCQKIYRAVDEAVQRLAKHPALLCYTLGNEIPAGIVRWHGHKAIEKFIRRLYRRVRKIDRLALTTYVNYPTTEYLQLGFLDLQCFNVYLESPETLEAYLARLQNIAGDKPLLMSEIGLDSRRNGEDAQAECLRWQIRGAFTSGCAGMFVYAWTDEWHRGGYDIDDWDFGLTTRDREPKPALQAVSEAFREIPFPAETQWPAISVVCCSHNGSATIRDTLEGLKDLPYPDYEVIVVNDGSTDRTMEIAGEYDVRLINLKNGGLSNARNVGWQAATGDIIAYIDDDAYPDDHWLHYLAWRFMHSDFVGVGGPNIPPSGDGRIADCISNAPGGPVHVLLSDLEAEHIPGCNMAFRRDALAAIDGFDPRYRTAGDDVDLCWRLQGNGGQLGFHAGAMNWHHRRNSIKTYWKQQQGYGKAEALLEEKWPHKYNAAGHLSWSGRLYGRGLTEAIPYHRSRIYGGPWGVALFQSMYQPGARFWNSLPLMPEWYLLTVIVAALTLLGLVWSRLLMLWPLLMIGLVAPVIQAVLSAIKADFPTRRPSFKGRLALRTLTAVMHIIQPLARLIGRLRHGLTPWRKRISIDLKDGRLYTGKIWSETWRAPEAWLGNMIRRLEHERIPATQGGDFDAWDIAVRGGLIGRARLRIAIEEHGGGQQLLRYRIVPQFSLYGVMVIALLSLLACFAIMEGARIAYWILLISSVALMIRATREFMLAAGALSCALGTTAETTPAAENGRELHAGGENEYCVEPEPAS